MDESRDVASEQGELSRPRAPWKSWDWILLSCITLVAAVSRLIHLADPGEYVFDETYYAKDACWYVNASPSLCEVSNETTMVHPPLGKWLIAIGIRIFGYDSFGWRISALVAGTLTVALLYVLARRALRSSLAAALASGLLAIDTLHFVQSRISMLDIFVPLFGLAGVLCVVLDRDTKAKSAGLRLSRPWLLAAGICSGAAVASKWSGAFYAAFIFALALGWEIGDARRARTVGPGDPPDELAHGGADEGLRDGSNDPAPERRAPARIAVAALVAMLVIVPMATYAVTYIGRLPPADAGCPGREGFFLKRLAAQQRCMADFHQDLPSNHSYQSPAWSWPLLKRPVSYFFCAGDDCKPPEDPDVYEEIIGTGSPFTWWTSHLALAFVAFRWSRSRDGAAGLIIGGFVATYVPWLLLDVVSPRDATFFFYMLPSVPFMCLALAYVATRIGWSWEARSAVGIFAAGALIAFVFYYPILVKQPLQQKDWDRRIWFFDNCDKPQAAATATDSSTTAATTGTEDPSSLPPPGWCWI